MTGVHARNGCDREVYTGLHSGLIVDIPLSKLYRDISSHSSMIDNSLSMKRQLLSTFVASNLLLMGCMLSPGLAAVLTYFPIVSPDSVPYTDSPDSPPATLTPFQPELIAGSFTATPFQPDANTGTFTPSATQTLTLTPTLTSTNETVPSMTVPRSNKSAHFEYLAFYSTCKPGIMPG